MIRMVKIRTHERGLLFEDREFRRVLRPGRHWLVDWAWRSRVDVVSVREPWLRHAQLDVIVRTGALGDEAVTVDLTDAQRALVWIEGRFAAVLGPGLHALWRVVRDIRVEVLDARGLRLEHEQLPVILGWPGVAEFLETVTIEAGRMGLLYRDGRIEVTLGAGTHAFWKGMGRVRLQIVDLREQVADVAGQEIMTADKVTLRLNAVVTYRVTDVATAVTEVEDYKQALYREAQLALRAVIGTRDLDRLLSEKDAVAQELLDIVRARAAAFGVGVTALGIRDVILPGEMKDLMNKVTEARKAAEAALITRREETAAMRAQANTARLLETTPVLMRLRELEVLEKVADKANLTVVLGEGGLADRVVKLL
jgi:regulator of protease activity HflC (stomatin/prohibitin superfamily)